MNGSNLRQDQRREVRLSTLVEVAPASEVEGSRHKRQATLKLVSLAPALPGLRRQQENVRTSKLCSELDPATRERENF